MKTYKVLLSIVAILVLMLSLIGCQGYQTPTYKSPADSKQESEEVEIDIGDDLGDETLDDEEFFEDESNWWEEEPEADEGVAEENNVVSGDVVYEVSDEDFEDEVESSENVPSAYKPAIKKESLDKADSQELTKSPYRSLYEDDLQTHTVTEGDLVKMKIKAKDPDGDLLQYTFTSPLDSLGRWQTTVGDAGVYYPEITISDGKDELVKRIKLIVEPKNQKPILEFIPNMVVTEGEVVVFNPSASDEDGDRLSFSYSGWMESSTKQTDYADQGVHKVVVSVTDGISIVSQEVSITVKDKNRLPDDVEVEF